MGDFEESLGERLREGHPGLLDDDDFYRSLAARPRRRVLAYLVEAGESTVDELAELLCGWAATSGSPVNADSYRAYRIALLHQHLPRLADAGLVDYDDDAGRVAPADLPDAIEELVRRSVDDEGR